MSRSHIARAVALLFVWPAATVAAQVPGVPVLQNAFLNSGLAFAANVGGGGGSGGGSGQGFFGAAAGWGLSGGKFQLSAAAGAQRSRGASRGAYGGKVAANVWNSRGGSLGAGAFVGVGGAPRTRTDDVVTNPAVMSMPVGVSIGYKRPLGASRGFSVFAAPMFMYTRADSGAVVATSAFAFSGGVDFAFTQSLGVTLGGEFGGGRSARRSSFGGAISFVPGRR